MKLPFNFTKKTEKKLSDHLEQSKKRRLKERAPVEGPMVGYPIPKNFQIIERYTLAPPFAYAVIAEDPSSKLPYYFVDELELTEQEKMLYSSIIAVLQTELKAPREEVNPKKYFAQEAQKIVDRYRMMRAANVQASWAKILYYFVNGDYTSHYFGAAWVVWVWDCNTS
ncbi:MAG: hypothetical protein JRN15_23795, partial [Nitrososphaerota archaeon]|nr:hypothetical protein [Nitrososphaerota archaeon]